MGSVRGVAGAILGRWLRYPSKGKPPKGSVKSEREQASRDNIYQIMMVFHPRPVLTPASGPEFASLPKIFPTPKSPGNLFQP